MRRAFTSVKLSNKTDASHRPVVLAPHLNPWFCHAAHKHHHNRMTDLDGEARLKVKNLGLLRDVLAATGRSQRDIAQDAGVHHSTLANIAVGRRGCSPDVAERLCQTLRVPTELLFEISILDDNSSSVA